MRRATRLATCLMTLALGLALATPTFAQQATPTASYPAAGATAPAAAATPPAIPTTAAAATPGTTGGGAQPAGLASPTAAAPAATATPRTAVTVVATTVVVVVTATPTPVPAQAGRSGGLDPLTTAGGLALLALIALGGGLLMLRRPAS